MKVFNLIPILCLSSVSASHFTLVDTDRWRYAREPRFIQSGYLQEASNESDNLKIDADHNAEIAEIADASSLDNLKESGHNSCPCASAVNNRRFLHRIVGGRFVPDSISFPYQAMLLASGQACGATIINRRFVLTAMHCIIDLKPPRDDLNHTLEDTLIFIGSNKLSRSSGQVLKIKRYINHPDFVMTLLQNDIALVEVDKDIAFDDKVQPACLPTSREEKYVGRDAIVTGWGSTVGYDEDSPEEPSFPNSLKQTVVKVLDSSDPNCLRDSLGDGVRKMCAYKNGTDACQGDSGGPLTVVEEGVYVVIGVVSYGIGCAKENHPGVYTRVNNYLQWIVENSRGGRC